MSWRAGLLTSLLMGVAGLLLVFGESMTLTVLGGILFVVALLPIIGEALDR